MRIQPREKKRKSIHNNLSWKVAERIELIAKVADASKALVQTVLLAKILDIELGDDYEDTGIDARIGEARKNRSRS